jgi:hypothetical protein
LKIEVDQTVADEWIELDAVEVIGSVTGMYLLIFFHFINQLRQWDNISNEGG